MGAFAQFAHLPKMLNQSAILDTLVRGCEEGAFVLRLTRPDKSVKTYWRERPDEAALKAPALELVLQDAAELTELGYHLLSPGRLPGLWSGTELKVQQIYDHFSGGRVVKVDKGSHEEPMTIPKAAASVIDEAVNRAVKEGRLWLTVGSASLLGEEIPAGILTGDAILQAPPEAIPAPQLLPENLPEAWKDGQSTALSMAVVLSRKLGKTLPWGVVRDAIDGAFRARLLERTVDSGTWPCDYSTAVSIKIKVPEEVPPARAAEKTKFGVKVAEADLRTNELQDLSDLTGEIAQAAAGYELKLSVRVELGGEKVPPDNVIEAVNQLLAKVSDRLKLK